MRRDWTLNDVMGASSGRRVGDVFRPTQGVPAGTGSEVGSITPG